MATAMNQKHPERLLQCPICQELLSEPKTLTCFHSFCEKCIKQLDEVSEENRTGFKCPVCRAFTARSEVKVNFLVKELLEMSLSKESGRDHLCEQCVEKKPIWKCMDCKITLCKKCHKNHLRVPLLKGHRILPIDDETDMVVDRLVFCSKHTDQPIIFNCSQCEVALCIKCKVTQHESHRTETIEDTLERILPEVETYVKHVKVHIEDLDENKEVLEGKKTEIREAFNKCRKQNKENMEKIIERAKQQQREMEKVLDMKEDEEIGKIDRWLHKRSEYEQLAEWVATCNQTAKGVSLMSTIQTGLLQKLKSVSSMKRLPEVKLTVDIPALTSNPEQESLVNMTGSVSYKTARVFKPAIFNGRCVSLLYKDILSYQLIRQKNIGLSGRCTRIEVIDGEIWAPIPSNNRIQVFDLEGIELSSITGISSPRSVKQHRDGEIICASDYGLYITDSAVSPTKWTRLAGATEAYSDVSIKGDKMVAISYSMNQVQCFEKTAGTWSKQGNLPSPQKVSSPEGTVLMSEDIILSHPGTICYYFRS